MSHRWFDVLKVVTSAVQTKHFEQKNAVVAWRSLEQPGAQALFINGELQGWRVTFASLVYLPMDSKWALASA